MNTAILAVPMILQMAQRRRQEEERRRKEAERRREAEHSAQLTAFITDLRDLLEEIEDWAINGKEPE